VGALPAVINAVVDALAPLGVREFDMPATSERVGWGHQGGERPLRSCLRAPTSRRRGPSVDGDGAVLAERLA
jgi:aerobic carbon-monoxide dehydrogenase large subunit